MRMLVHLTQKVLSSATLSNEVFYCSFLFKNLLFVCLPQQRIVIYSTTTGTKKKVVGGNYNVSVFYKNASAPDPEGVVPLSNEIFCCVYIATC